MKRFVAIALAVSCSSSAFAHGIAGNRFFPGTLTFDDPAVADEAILPGYSELRHPSEGALVNDDTFNWSFVRLLTPTIAVSIDSGWIHRSWGDLHRSGFDTTNVGIKGEIFRNNEHETLVSAGVAWGIGRSGAQGVGANGPDTIQPGIFFGKGFGDLPDSLTWLRPFAIAGSVVAELPTGGTGRSIAPDPLTDIFASMPVLKVETLHWGFAIEYSTYYLTKRFTGGQPKEEPLNQLVPLVEFSFDSPRAQKTAATMNPGLSYVAVTWQLAAEAILPLNHEGGRGTGFRAQLLFFIDDLMPSLFGKPLLTDQPSRSLTAW